MKKATSSLIAAIALVLFGPNLHAAEGAEAQAYVTADESIMNYKDPGVYTLTVDLIAKDGTHYPSDWPIVAETWENDLNAAFSSLGLTLKETALFTVSLYPETEIPLIEA